METEEHTHTRWPLPQRSAADRKLGGVAGGLGRAWRIDPVLIRVAFVVLALFGGSGVALYCAGWLLMRGDGDEVSALESLGGRGRSSVSPALTVVLIVIGLLSMGSIFSWGIPFWPVLIGAIVLIVILSNRRRTWGGPHGSCGAPRRDPSQWADDFAARASAWGRDVGDRAARWGRDMGDKGWFGGASTTQTASTMQADTAAPTDTPAADGSAAWTAPAGWAAPTGQAASGAPAPAGAATGAATAAAPEAEPAAPPEPEDLLTDGRTPPAWDPLGAAPFAWDLPDPLQPTQVSEVAETGSAVELRRQPGSVIARVFLGLALIVGSIGAAVVTSAETDAQWSYVAGAALGVLAVGMLLAALRGRGARLLIGPGIFVAVLTLALTVTGFRGVGGIGQHTWAPTSVNSLQGSYFWNAGDATLDLSQVTFPSGEIHYLSLTVGAGQATVILPQGVSVEADCLAPAGEVDCLGQRDQGLQARAAASIGEAPVQMPDGTVKPSDAPGFLSIQVRSNAGKAVVTQP